MRTETQADKLNSGAELITRAQHGDSQAFAALFEMHKPRIYAICLRMTNNIAEAEDLTQDAFIHVFRKLSTFRGESAFSTWLYRIAVNTVLMHFRKRSNRQISLDQPVQKDATAPKREYGRVDDRLAGSVDRLALARAINELPPGYRTIFLMHEVQGYEHQEIARLLKCSIGNSKSQLHKAKLRMRRLLIPSDMLARQTDESASAEGQSARQVEPAAVLEDGEYALKHRSASSKGKKRFDYVLREPSRSRKSAPNGQHESDMPLPMPAGDASAMMESGY